MKHPNIYTSNYVTPKEQIDFTRNSRIGARAKFKTRECAIKYCEEHNIDYAHMPIYLKIEDILCEYEIAIWIKTTIGKKAYTIYVNDLELCTVEENIRSLELSESYTFTDSNDNKYTVLRIAQGFIYNNKNGNVFVPN